MEIETDARRDREVERAGRGVPVQFDNPDRITLLGHRDTGGGFDGLIRDILGDLAYPPDLHGGGDLAIPAEVDVDRTTKEVGYHLRRCTDCPLLLQGDRSMVHRLIE